MVKKVRVWRDPWIPRAGSCKPLGERGSCRYSRVADFISPEGSWNEERLRQYMIVADVQEILKIKVSRKARDDFLAWNPEKDGRFSVRRAYHIAVNQI